MIKKSRAYAVGFLFLWSTFSYADEPNTVVATIAVGDTPAGIAVTPNNLFAYVANNNNDAIPNGDTVSVLNLTYNTLEQTIMIVVLTNPIQSLLMQLEQKLM